MSVETVKEALKEKMRFAGAIDAKIKIDFDDEGVVFIDATQTPPELSEKDEDADLTLRCSMDTFQGILNGTQDPNVAFMMGKLKVQGSMELALKLNSILED